MWILICRLKLCASVHVTHYIYCPGGLSEKKGHPVLFSFFENIIVLCLAFVILIFKVAIIGIFKLVVFVF